MSRFDKDPRFRVQWGLCYPRKEPGTPTAQVPPRAPQCHLVWLECFLTQAPVAPGSWPPVSWLKPRCRGPRQSWAPGFPAHCPWARTLAVPQRRGPAHAGMLGSPAALSPAGPCLGAHRFREVEAFSSKIPRVPRTGTCPRALVLSPAPPPSHPPSCHL